MPVVGHLADPYLAHMDLATPYDRLRDFIDRMATIGDKPEDDGDLTFLSSKNTQALRLSSPSYELFSRS